MPMNPVMHALGLHLYQPLDNLHTLLRENPEELRRILLCYERIGRYANKYAGVARLHVALSTVLLEQLKDPKLIKACRDLVDIPSVLESLRSAPNIEFIGTGFRHAPLPFIPQEDWQEQLQLERELVSATFGRTLKGYLPPSAFFSVEMVPALVSAGYEYLLLPTQMLMLSDGGDADPYRPYRLSYKQSSITVIPVDAGFSQSQQYGLEAPWFADEVRNGVMLALPYSAPYLLTTWSDGENGEWFRTYEEHGFFGAFFSPYMEFTELGAFPVQPVSISEYLDSYPVQTEAVLKPEYMAAPVFPGDPGAKRKLSKLVAQYWIMAKHAPEAKAASNDAALTQARTLLLRAEESGLLLGESSSAAKLMELLKQVEKLLSPTSSTDTKEMHKEDLKKAATPLKVSEISSKHEVKKPAQPVVQEKQPMPKSHVPTPDLRTKAPPAKNGATNLTGKSTLGKDKPHKK